MNTSLENLTHKMQRAAVGKMVDVVLSHADKDPEKTMGQIVDLAKQFYGSSFSDETYERAKKTLSDPDMTQPFQIDACSQAGVGRGTLCLHDDAVAQLAGREGGIDAADCAEVRL